MARGRAAALPSTDHRSFEPYVLHTFVSLYGLLNTEDMIHSLYKSEGYIKLIEGLRWLSGYMCVYPIKNYRILV